MTEVLNHSPAPDEQEVITYQFVENELNGLNEVFDLLFEKLENEQPQINIDSCL